MKVNQLKIFKAITECTNYVFLRPINDARVVQNEIDLASALDLFVIRIHILVDHWWLGFEGRGGAVVSVCWRRGSFLWKAGKFFPQGQPHFRFVQFLETDETPSTQFCSFSSFWFYKAVLQSVAASFSEGRSFKSQSRCSNWDVNKGSQVMNKLPPKSAKNLKFKMQNTILGLDTLEKKRWHVCQGHKITIPDSVHVISACVDTL